MRSVSQPSAGQDTTKLDQDVRGFLWTFLRMLAEITGFAFQVSQASAKASRSTSVLMEIGRVMTQV